MENGFLLFGSQSYMNPLIFFHNSRVSHKSNKGRHEPNAFSWLDGTLHEPELVGGEGDDIIFALADPPDQRAAVRPEFHRLKYVRIAQPLENAALRKYWRQIDHIVELWPVVVIEAQEQPSIPVSKKLQFLYRVPLRLSVPHFHERRGNVLGVLGGVLDLPEPRFAVARVIVNHEVEAGVLALSRLAGPPRPGTYLNRHRVGVDAITHRLPSNRGFGHGRKLLS